MDLGGGSQRKISRLLGDGDIEGAEELLCQLKATADVPSRAFILTGGAFEARRHNCACLAGALPEWRFVVVSPRDEGWLTLCAADAALRQLLSASAGAQSVALVVAKGTTDLHLGWVDAEGVAVAEGSRLSEVHCPSSDAPSRARELFEEFVAREDNAPLRTAWAAGGCAIVMAGMSVHAVGGTRVCAKGTYFHRLSRVEIAAVKDEGAAKPARSGFEAFVVSEWGSQAEPRNPVYVGAASAESGRSLRHTSPGRKPAANWPTAAPAAEAPADAPAEARV